MKLPSYQKAILYVVLFIIVTGVLAFSIDFFYILGVRAFIFVLLGIVMVRSLTKFAVKKLANWLEYQVGINPNILYRNIYLKPKATELVNIDHETHDRNRLSKAELEGIEALFKKTLVSEIQYRLAQVARGELNLFSWLRIRHDLWGLAIFNLVLLFTLFLCTLYLVFILRYLYHY